MSALDNVGNNMDDVANAIIINETEGDDLQQQINQLKNEVSSLEHEMNNLDLDISNIPAIERQTETNKEGITELNQSLNGFINDYNTDILEIKSDINSIDTSLNNMNEAIANNYTLANNLYNSKLDKVGGTITGDLQVNGDINLKCGGNNNLSIEDTWYKNGNSGFNGFTFNIGRPFYGFSTGGNGGTLRVQLGSSSTFFGNVDMKQSLTIQEPTEGNQAATKNYVDNQINNQGQITAVNNEFFDNVFPQHSESNASYIQLIGDNSMLQQSGIYLNNQETTLIDNANANQFSIATQRRTFYLTTPTSGRIQLNTPSIEGNPAYYTERTSNTLTRKSYVDNEINYVQNDIDTKISNVNSTLQGYVNDLNNKISSLENQLNLNKTYQWYFKGSVSRQTSNAFNLWNAMSSYNNGIQWGYNTPEASTNGFVTPQYGTWLVNLLIKTQYPQALYIEVMVYDSTKTNLLQVIPLVRNMSLNGTENRLTSSLNVTIPVKTNNDKQIITFEVLAYPSPSTANYIEILGSDSSGIGQTHNTSGSFIFLGQ